MKYTLLAFFSLSILAGPAAAAEDPQVAIFSLLTADERTMMAGVLSDPAQAAAFQQEAAAAADNPQAIKEAVIRWRAKLVTHASDYLKRQPATNTAGKSVKEMVEPAEWGVLMQYLRTMEAGIKKDIILAMIKDANEKLAKGDNSRALPVIATARGSLKESAVKYLQTGEAKGALAEAEKLAAASAARDKAALDAARRAKDQAQRAKEQAERAKTAPAEEAKTGPAPVYDGDNSKGAPVVDAGGKTDPETAAETAPTGKRPDLALNPPKPGEKRPAIVVPSPSTGSDEEELAKMESGSGGAKTVKKWAMAGGGLLGIIVGAFFGPVGLAVGLAVGIGAGYLTSKVLLRGA
ncbi:MAG: hypothetical protein HY748_01885 [Elusimicrobia bacterium]|nr:hypothetical protein [Elusimicrobiota bacterium]